MPCASAILLLWNLTFFHATIGPLFAILPQPSAQSFALFPCSAPLQSVCSCLLCPCQLDCSECSLHHSSKPGSRTVRNSPPPPTPPHTNASTGFCPIVLSSGLRTRTHQNAQATTALQKSFHGNCERILGHAYSH